MTLAEYDDRVGSRNKRFHESAEGIRLAREGIIPLDEDDRPDHPELDTEM